MQQSLLAHPSFRVARPKAGFLLVEYRPWLPYTPTHPRWKRFYSSHGHIKSVQLSRFPVSAKGTPMATLELGTIYSSDQELMRALHSAGVKQHCLARSPYSVMVRQLLVYSRCPALALEKVLVPHVFETTSKEVFDAMLTELLFEASLEAAGL